MSKLTTTRIRLEDPYHNYTLAALEDRLTYVFSSNKTAEVVEEQDCEDWHDRIYIHHPYLQQAEELLYKINVYDPLPEFVIFTEDIPEGLVRELAGLGEITMNEVVTNSIRRIYESIDPEYFHTNGIYGKVKWRFGRSKK